MSSLYIYINRLSNILEVLVIIFASSVKDKFNTLRKKLQNSICDCYN